MRFPGHAYIPGQTKRHPEGCFDVIRASVTADLGPSDLAQSQAWKTGLAFFDAGYFWEAHEVLEPVWLQAPPNSTERLFIQALIQLSNARLKLCMDRPKATLRLCATVDTLLLDCEISGRDDVMGMLPSILREWLHDTRQIANLAVQAGN
ncbi:MAG: DUF309 domain-containing protein [Marinosulfonomonas sp.]|nr:DUF309 domain-containing protein [Marinosulfonomonas sp.]